MKTEKRQPKKVNSCWIYSNTTEIIQGISLQIGETKNLSLMKIASLTNRY